MSASKREFEKWEHSRPLVEVKGTPNHRRINITTRSHKFHLLINMRTLELYVLHLPKRGKIETLYPEGK